MELTIKLGGTLTSFRANIAANLFGLNWGGNSNSFTRFTWLIRVSSNQSV